MKVLTTLLLTLWLSSSALSADEQFPFIGASLSYYEATPDTTAKTTHTVGTFRFGRQSLRWRTTFTLSYGKDYGSAGMDVDYIPFDTMFGTPKIRPYIGINLNYLYYDNDHIDDSNGYSYGVQGGVILYATDRVDIDLDYRYDLTGGIEGLDHLQGATLAVHYFF